MKKKFLLVYLLLVFLVAFSSCSNSKVTIKPLLKKPIYEHQFDNVTYNTCTYILNKNTNKFHLKFCYAIKLMNSENIIYCDDIRENIINHNYIPCSKCNP